MKTQNISFSVSFFQRFYLKKSGGMGKKSPKSVPKNAPFWGGYVRQE